MDNNYYMHVLTAHEIIEAMRTFSSVNSPYNAGRYSTSRKQFIPGIGCMPKLAKHLAESSGL